MPTSVNIVTGTSNADKLKGTSGTDVLIGLDGADVIDGAGGSDTVDYSTDAASGGAAGVTVDLALGTATDGFGATDTLLNIENVRGTDRDDTIAGNASANFIDGGLGNDVMSGGAGNDTYIVDSFGDTVVEAEGGGTDTVSTALASYTLGTGVENLIYTGTGNFVGAGNELDNSITGGSWNDILVGAGGADTLAGGNGDDLYIVTDGADTIRESAGGGYDTVFALADVTLAANVEKLVLQGGADLSGTGNSGANWIEGNSGSNRIDGKGGIDTMVGGLGDDTYVVDNPGDVVTEFDGQGHDIVIAMTNYILADNVEDLVIGGVKNFSGTGNALANRIDGNAANNLIDGGAGADTMAGGAGDDTYVVDDAHDVVIEGADQGFDTIRTSFSHFDLGMVANVEKLVYTGSEDFVGLGGLGNEWLVGGSGSDDLDGDVGADTMQGGTGDDTYHVDNAGDVVIETGVGHDVVYSSVSYTLSSNVEDLYLFGDGSGQGLSGTGNALANLIVGDSFNNVLDGKAGADTMIGGLGDDVYVVDNVGDVVFDTGLGHDRVESSVSYKLGDLIEDLTLTGSGNVSGTGNVWDNVILGNSGANLIDGQAGNDTMAGGAGNDTYVVDSYDDVVIENADGGIDTIRTDLHGFDLTRLENVENLVFTGGGDFSGTGNASANVITGGIGNDFIDGLAGNDSLNGGAGDDTVVGGAGNDVIRAGDGADHIYGDAGNDWLYGGRGADTFVFQGVAAGMGPFGTDRVQDFEAGQDKIRFEGVTGLADFADVVAAATDAAAGLTIKTADGTVILSNLHKSDMTSGMFDFG